MKLVQMLREAIEDCNAFRSLEDKRFRVDFTRYFCRTCGFSDYFEDFQEKLRVRGVETKKDPGWRCGYVSGILSNPIYSPAP